MQRTVTAVVLVLAVAACAFGADLCPVTGRPANDKYTFEYQGTTYHFSSRGAMKLFQLKPERYVKPVAEQKLCPVMGGAIDKKVFTDHEGRRVYFCCPACIETFKKDPATYLAKVDAQRAARQPESCAKDCKDGHGHAATPKPPVLPKPVTRAVPACGNG